MEDFNWIPSILVILGWGVFIFDNNRRTRRTEIRALVNDAINIIEDLEKVAHSYWIKQGNDPILAAEIKRGVPRLVRIINVLKRHDGKFDVLDKIKIFRQTMTTGEFETKSRTAVNINAPRITDISEAAFDLTDNLEIIFDECYCAPWWG